jgi:hypothetical protein
MFSALPTASLRISELLAPPFRFSIPPYQRPYSWTTREAGQLLEDVLAASGAEDDIAADPDYFFGTILLLDASGDESPIGSDPWRSRGFEIVDGQQRLVTLTILACVLRDLERGAGEEIDARLDRLVASPADERTGSPRRHRITLRGREHQFLADHVQSPGGCASQPDHDALSVGEAAILDVRQHFLSELANLDAQARRALSAYLCERCHVVVILTRDVDRAHRMFMVLNERGNR